MFGNSGVNYVFAVGGAYLIYLAVKLILSYFRGESSIGFFALLVAAFFIAAGAWIMIREWKNYQKFRNGEFDKEEEIKVDVDYAIDVNYEYMADCKISLKIQALGK